MKAELLYKELANNLDFFKAFLSDVTQTEAQNKPDANSWSILEVVCHLLDEEREDFRQRLEITLNRPGDKWPPIDPQGWVLTRKYNEQSLEDVLAEFLEERRKSLDWLVERTSPDWEQEYSAPFGRIKAGDLLTSWVMHDLLHLRQLVELRREKLKVLSMPYSTAYAGDW